MQKGRSISKKKRLLVYEKYGHRCAYCGCGLEYKDLIVDHIESVWINHLHGDKSGKGLNDIDNLMPSCRMCNFYKTSGDIEFLRKRLSEELMRNLRKSFTYCMALKYGLVEEHVKPVEFYFEKETSL